MQNTRMSKWRSSLMLAGLLTAVVTATVGAHQNRGRGYRVQRHAAYVEQVPQSQRQFKRGFVQGKSAAWHKGFNDGLYGRPFGCNPDLYLKGYKSRHFRRGFRTGYRQGYAEAYKAGQQQCPGQRRERRRWWRRW